MFSLQRRKRRTNLLAEEKRNILLLEEKERKKPFCAEGKRNILFAEEKERNKPFFAEEKAGARRAPTPKRSRSQCRGKHTKVQHLKQNHHQHPTPGIERERETEPQEFKSHSSDF